jgi:LacI family transcriptional regulator
MPTLTRNKVTIYDVAARANVAISTVSRVLNNSNDVSTRTRAVVLTAIDELKFRPDRTAKTLALQQSQSLAIALPTFTTPFHNELLKGVRDSVREADIDFLLCDLGSKNPRQKLLNFLSRGAVDGLLLAGVHLDHQLAKELQALHAPVVLIGNQWDGFDNFYWDDVAGARAAVEHLIKVGHTRIGMIRAYTESDLQNGRVRGYQDALSAAGLPVDWNLVATGHTQKHAGFSEEAGYEAMQILLQVEPAITAVFASSDVQALGAWKAVIDQGKRVPDDISIVGYDDIKTSSYIGLSSVDQSMQQIGYRAASLLLKRMNNRFVRENISDLVTPRLQIRRSSKSTS